jgi:hypothetical protein
LDKCYLCGKIFDGKKVEKHDEHIIQHAIGGNFTVNDILCSYCGGKLGKVIDVPFNKIFEGISTRLDIKTDRQRNKRKAIKGKMGCLDVIWKDFKIYPLKPFHLYSTDKKSITIYADLKTAKKYRKKVENEIINNFHENEKPNILVCDDLEGLVKFPFQMNSQAFKKGLAKIAIGFASKHGIEREKLPLVLEIDKKNQHGVIRDKIFAIQFYPLGIIDRLIEIQKHEFEPYPFHNLILFTLDYDPKISEGKKVLICYVELFSTFQWYVVLNDEYYGDSIYEYYAQQILKKDDYNVELGRRYHKERDLWLKPLRITEEYIDKKYNNRKDKSQSRWDIEYKIIQEKTIKQKYRFDFESYIHRIIDHISRQALMMINKERFKKTEFKNTRFGGFINSQFYMKEYEFLEKPEDIFEFKKNMDLFIDQKYNERYHNHYEIFSILSYRRIFYHNDNLENYYTELLEKRGAFKAYGHKKMNVLEDYIQKESINRKTQQNAQADA